MLTPGTTARLTRDLIDLHAGTEVLVVRIDPDLGTVPDGFVACAHPARSWPFCVPTDHLEIVE